MAWLNTTTSARLVERQSSRHAAKAESRGAGGGSSTSSREETRAFRIVTDDEDRRAFVAGLARTAERFGWLVHAYCLMDTHVHLIVETSGPTLGSGMQRLTGSYAYEFNRRHGRYGHLFAGRYSASVIDTDAHAIVAGAYVVLNPVRAGMVADAVDWAWSSYRASAGLVRAPAFLETRLLPAMLHNDIGRARELYRELVNETAANLTPGSG